MDFSCTNDEDMSMGFPYTAPSTAGTQAGQDAGQLGQGRFSQLMNASMFSGTDRAEMSPEARMRPGHDSPPPPIAPPPVSDIAAEAGVPSPIAATAANPTVRDMPPPAVMQDRDNGGDELPGGTQVDTTQMTQQEASRGAPQQLAESLAASREAQLPGEPSHTLVMDNETFVEGTERDRATETLVEGPRDGGQGATATELAITETVVEASTTLVATSTPLPGAGATVAAPEMDGEGMPPPVDVRSVVGDGEVGVASDSTEAGAEEGRALKEGEGKEGGAAAATTTSQSEVEAQSMEVEEVENADEPSDAGAVEGPSLASASGGAEAGGDSQLPIASPAPSPGLPIPDAASEPMGAVGGPPAVPCSPARGTQTPPGTPFDPDDAPLSAPPLFPSLGPSQFATSQAGSQSQQATQMGPIPAAHFPSQLAVDMRLELRQSQVNSQGQPDATQYTQMSQQLGVLVPPEGGMSLVLLEEADRSTGVTPHSEEGQRDGSSGGQAAGASVAGGGCSGDGSARVEEGLPLPDAIGQPATGEEVAAQDESVDAPHSSSSHAGAAPESLQEASAVSPPASFAAPLLPSLPFAASPSAATQGLEMKDTQQPVLLNQLEVAHQSQKPAGTQDSQPATSQAKGIDWALQVEVASAREEEEEAMEVSDPVTAVAPEEAGCKEMGGEMEAEQAPAAQVAVSSEVAAEKPEHPATSAAPMEVEEEQQQEAAHEAPNASPWAAPPAPSAPDTAASRMSPPGATSAGGHGFKTPVSTGGKPTPSASVEAALTSPSPSPRSSVAAPDFASPDGQQSVEDESPRVEKTDASPREEEEEDRQTAAAEASRDRDKAGAKIGEERGLKIERVEMRVEGQQLGAGAEDRPTDGEGGHVQGAQSSSVAKAADGHDQTAAAAEKQAAEPAVGIHVEEEAAGGKEGEGGADEEEDNGREGGMEETAPTVVVGSQEQESETNGGSQAGASSIDVHARALFAMRDVSVPDAPVHLSGTPPRPPARRSPANAYWSAASHPESSYLPSQRASQVNPPAQAEKQDVAQPPSPPKAAVGEDKAEGKKKRTIRRLAEPSQDPDDATPATYAQEAQAQASPTRQSVGAEEKEEEEAEEEEEEEEEGSVNLLTSPQSYSGTGLSMEEDVGDDASSLRSSLVSSGAKDREAAAESFFAPIRVEKNVREQERLLREAEALFSPSQRSQPSPSPAKPPAKPLATAKERKEVTVTAPKKPSPLKGPPASLADAKEGWISNRNRLALPPTTVRTAREATAGVGGGGPEKPRGPPSWVLATSKAPVNQDSRSREGRPDRPTREEQKAEASQGSDDVAAEKRRRRVAVQSDEEGQHEDGKVPTPLKQRLDGKQRQERRRIGQGEGRDGQDDEEGEGEGVQGREQDRARDVTTPAASDASRSVHEEEGQPRDDLTTPSLSLSEEGQRMSGPSPGMSARAVRILYEQAMAKERELAEKEARLSAWEAQLCSRTLQQEQEVMPPALSLPITPHAASGPAVPTPQHKSASTTPRPHDDKSSGSAAGKEHRQEDPPRATVAPTRKEGAPVAKSGSDKAGASEAGKPSPHRKRPLSSTPGTAASSGHKKSPPPRPVAEPVAAPAESDGMSPNLDGFISIRAPLRPSLSSAAKTSASAGHKAQAADSAGGAASAKQATRKTSTEAPPEATSKASESGKGKKRVHRDEEEDQEEEVFDDDGGYLDDGFDDDDWGAEEEEEEGHARQRKRLHRKGEGARRVSFARTSVVTSTTAAEEVVSPGSGGGSVVVSKKVRREAAAAAARQRREGSIHTTTSLLTKTKTFQQEGGGGGGRAAKGRRKKSSIMFQHLWAYLKKERGWHYKKGSGLVNWYYIRPGCTVVDGVQGEDFFITEADVLAYCEDNDLLPPDEHNSQELREARALLLDGWPSEESEAEIDQVRRPPQQQQQPQQQPTSAEKQDEREYRWRKNQGEEAEEGSDEEGSDDRRHNARQPKRSPKASHPKKAPKPPAEPPSPISVCSSEEGGRRGEEKKRKREYLPVSFHQLWSFLKEQGWKYCQARGLHDSYYLRPGRVFHPHTSRHGEDYFSSAKEVEAYCLKHDILPDTAHDDEEEEVEEMVEDGDGLADVPSSADSRKGSRASKGKASSGSKQGHGKKPRSTGQHAKAAAASHHRRGEEEEGEEEEEDGMHVDDDDEEEQEEETHPLRPLSSAHRSLAAAERGRHTHAPLKPCQPTAPPPGLPPSSAPSKPRRPVAPSTHLAAVKPQRITRTSLFAGLHFLITGISPATKPTKKFLEGRIRNAGGTLIDNVVGLEPLGSRGEGRAEAFMSQDGSEWGGGGDGQMLNVPPSQQNGGQLKEVIVIATPAAYRRIKYLWGIASGSPVLHPDWVEECITKDRLQPYSDYQLPSGFSMLHKRFIFQDMPVTDVFQGYYVVLVCPPNVGADWKAVLKVAGAYAELIEDVDAQWFQKHRVDLVVCDAESVLADSFRQSPALDLLHKAMTKDGVSVRSFEWAVQSLVNGQLLDPDLSRSLTLDLSINLQERQVKLNRRREDGCLFFKAGVERYEVGDTAYITALPLAASSSSSSSSSAAKTGLSSPQARAASVANGELSFVRIERIIVQKGGKKMLDVHRLLTGPKGRAAKELSLMTAASKKRDATPELERVDAERLRGKFVMLTSDDYYAHLKYTMTDPSVYYSSATLE